MNRKARWRRVKPELPLPSNAIIREYADGSETISIPLPTPRVMEEYREAIRQDPENVPLRQYYGHALNALEDRDGAIEQYREAVRLKPESERMRVTLACALKDMGDVDGAIEQFQEAVRLEGPPVGAWQQERGLLRWSLSGALLLKGRTEEAVALLREAVALVELGVEQDAASPHLLRQLRADLARWE